MGDLAKYWKSLICTSAVFIALGFPCAVAQEVKITCSIGGHTCTFEYKGHIESCEEMVCRTAGEAYKKYFDDKENERKHQEEMERIRSEAEKARLKHEEEMRQKELANKEQMEKLRCEHARQSCHDRDLNKERECIARERCRD